MLFNSLDFILFFIVFYAIYLVINFKHRNKYLLFASYFFYGCWNWKFLFLLLGSTVVDYFCGLAIFNSDSPKKRKAILALSLSFNLLALGIFKYFNFFTDNIVELLTGMGLQANINSLEVILPVGISFYTFQTMSYTIDIYRKKLKPVTNFFDLALFVSFFPQLVAGPIERAVNLIPQILGKHEITREKVRTGCYLIAWGFYKKVFIADRCALLSDAYFNGSLASASFGDTVVGVLGFTFQIYGDFSGYSDIARGISRLLGFELMLNFRMPYFSQNPSDFWRRWHISLSSWLRDYLYISLGGNRRGSFVTYRNLFLTMLLGGLWHGAAWNFILWGGYHGLLLSIHRYSSTRLKLTIPSVLNILIMFLFTCYGWLLFRANNLDDIFYATKSLFSGGFSMANGKDLMQIIFLNTVLIFVQVQKEKTGDMKYIMNTNFYIKAFLLLTVGFSIFLLGHYSGSEFIYFQF